MTRPKEEAVTITIPNIDVLPDRELAQLAYRRDGRWSDQTKSLLNQFGTTKLDLNSGWASTWTAWECPCCKRGKPQIARISPGRVLLCRLEYHHDHLADHAKQIYREINPRSEDRDVNIQISRAKDALMLFIERFEQTLICIDCNLAEGYAKLELNSEIDKSFTFKPSEIARFIDVSENRLHNVDINKARATWLSAKDDFTDRVDFARRMSNRIAKGRHRREVAPGQRLLGQIDDRDLIYHLFSMSAPFDYRHRLGMQIESRSVSNDSAGRSLKPNRKKEVNAPTDLEFSTIESAQQENKNWVRAGLSWLCPCCGRSKREICRKSNKGRWTARIHRIVRYEIEHNVESILRRRQDGATPIIVGSYRSVLICHDCRNIVAEAQRRKPGLSEHSLTVENLCELVGQVTPHAPHEIDFDKVILMAIGNKPLLEAIDDFEDHRNRVIRILVEAKLRRWSREKARDIIGYEIAKENDWDLDEANSHAEWLLNEADRLSILDNAMM